MTDADVIAAHLGLYSHDSGLLRFSGFMHALREARAATGRDPDTGTKLAQPHGSWLGALGYFTLLEQIGRCFKPRAVARVRTNAISQALGHFTRLEEPSVSALYALRCAFAHDFSLYNVNDKSPSLTHTFAVTEGWYEAVVWPPQSAWDGQLHSRAPETTTTVSLEAFGDLVEIIVTDVRKLASAGELEVILQGGVSELGARYLFASNRTS